MMIQTPWGRRAVAATRRPPGECTAPRRLADLRPPDTAGGLRFGSGRRDEVQVTDPSGRSVGRGRPAAMPRVEHETRRTQPATSVTLGHGSVGDPRAQIAE
jgi:hypothetical protein